MKKWNDYYPIVTSKKHKFDGSWEKTFEKNCIPVYSQSMDKPLNSEEVKWFYQYYGYKCSFHF